MRRTALIVTISCGLAFLLLMPSHVRALGDHVVDAPSAWYEEHQYVTNAVNAQCLDGQYAVMADTSHDQYVNTIWFTNPGGFYGELPPDNATIHYVYVMACTLVTLGPRQYVLGYSLAPGASFNWSGIYTNGAGLNLVYWNVTTLEEWTAGPWDYAGLKKQGLRASIYSSDHTTMPLYVDYVGFRYNWSYPVGGGGGGGGGGGAWNWTGNFNLTGGLVKGIFGVTGFLGMIITPAAAVWYYKNSEMGRMEALVAALIIFLFCFALFVGSIGD